MRPFLVLFTALGAVAASPPGGARPARSGPPEDGGLRRRALFGARLAPVSPEARSRLMIAGEGGILLERILPGTSAAEAGLKDGDVLLSVDGAPVTGIPGFLARLARARAGDVLPVDVARGAARLAKRVALREMPREQGDGYAVLYGSVTSGGARLRTVVTRPPGEGPHPAVLLLQGGHTCFSIESAGTPPTGVAWIARHLGGRGWVTMRVERPGCGDSEGGPLRDVDLETEMQGLRQALRALKQLAFVDRDRVFLFGHSFGGMAAPLLAREEPVRGIAVYGTTADTWFESVLSQRRRLAALDGTDPAAVDAEMLDQARFWYALTVERRSPREIRERLPAVPRRVLDQWVTGDRYVAERDYRYYHQIAAWNLAEAWTRLGAGPARPRVLAVWGASDWLATRAGNAWIADVVNRAAPGSASFVALDGIDHFFFRAATPEESFRYFRPAPGAPAAELNPVFLHTLRAWLDETAGRRPAAG